MLASTEFICSLCSRFAGVSTPSKTIKDEANAPKKPATPVVPTPTASTSAVGALASSSKAAPAATLVQSAVTAADKAYHVALALFEVQSKAHSERTHILSQLCFDIAQRRDTIKQLIDRVPDKRQKKYYQPNLDSTIQQLADAQKQL